MNVFLCKSKDCQVECVVLIWSHMDGEIMRGGDHMTNQRPQVAFHLDVTDTPVSFTLIDLFTLLK